MTTAPTETPSLSASHIDDLKVAASKMQGAKRRSFQAAMALKYCRGSARQAETLFGWSRHTVELGLHGHRPGVIYLGAQEAYSGRSGPCRSLPEPICLGAQEAYSGRPLWEEKHPDVAQALWDLAESHAQQDPTFRTTLSYTRLTAAEALKQLRALGFADDVLPSPSTMAEVLNRNGYRLRPVVKAKPQKKIPETDAIFANIKDQDGHGSETGQVTRLSMACKATVNIGEYARGGKPRGDTQAADHDMGCQETYIPFGLVDEDRGELYLMFGSSAKTSEFIVDSLHAWWTQLPQAEQDACTRLQIKADNGPESSGRRTQFLNRMVECADTIGKPIHVLYYPPYHSKYNPIERCWGILERHWNGAKLVDVDILLGWAKSMTWKGLQPVVTLSRTLYQKGVSLSKAAMAAVEARLERNPLLPKWDILIRPA